MTRGPAGKECVEGKCIDKDSGDVTKTGDPASLDCGEGEYQRCGEFA